MKTLAGAPAFFILALLPAAALAQTNTIVLQPITKPIPTVIISPQQISAETALSEGAFSKAQGNLTAAFTTLKATQATLQSINPTSNSVQANMRVTGARSVNRSTETRAVQKALSTAISSYSSALRAYSTAYSVMTTWQQTTKTNAYGIELQNIESGLNRAGLTLFTGNDRASDITVNVETTFGTRLPMNPSSAASCDPEKVAAAKGAFDALSSICTPVSEALHKPQATVPSSLKPEPIDLGNLSIIGATITPELDLQILPAQQSADGKLALQASLLKSEFSVASLDLMLKHAGNDGSVTFSYLVPLSSKPTSISFDSGITSGSKTGNFVPATSQSIPIQGPRVSFLGLDADLELTVAPSAPYTYSIENGTAFFTFSPTGKVTAVGAVGANVWVAAAGLEATVDVVDFSASTYALTTAVSDPSVPAGGLLVGASATATVSAADGNIGFWYRALWFPRRIIPVVNWKGYSSPGVGIPDTWNYYKLAKQ